LISVTQQKARSQNTSPKSNFLKGDLVHGPEIFRVDAAYVAAQFPSRVVWGRNSMDGAIDPRRPSHAHFSEKLSIDVLALNNAIRSKFTEDKVILINFTVLVCFIMNIDHNNSLLL
jgi:hypothetical protein